MIALGEIRAERGESSLTLLLCRAVDVFSFCYLQASFFSIIPAPQPDRAALMRYSLAQALTRELLEKTKVPVCRRVELTLSSFTSRFPKLSIARAALDSCPSSYVLPSSS